MTSSHARPHVGVIIDHPKRDLPGSILLARALANKGCRTSLIPLYDQGLDVPLLELDALVVTFARPANRALVERYKASGIAVFVLDTEGGVLANDGPNNPTRLAHYVRESGFADLLDGYFFWGPVLRDAFVADGAMPTERLHLTGCPRFDFAAPRWRALLDYPRDGFILVNTAFPLVNSRFTSDGTDLAAMTAAGWPEEYVRTIAADSVATMQRMISLVRRMADALPERTFLVRPHPFERELPYCEALASEPNVMIDGAGSVLNAIAHSVGIVHLNCSTAIEAILLDRVPLSPDFISTDALRGHTELPGRVSVKPNDEIELLAMLRALPAIDPAFNFTVVFREHIAPFFHANDGAAAERMADVLASVPAKSRRPQYGEALRSSHSRPSSGQWMRGATALVLGSRGAGRLRARLQPGRRAKLFSAPEVRVTLEAAARHVGEAPPKVRNHVHPLTGRPLASIAVLPTGRGDGP